MIRSRIGRIVRVTIPVVLLVVVTSVVALSAQGNPTLNEVLAKLDTLIEMLPPTPAGPAKLATPGALLTPDQYAVCLVANVGAEPVTVGMEMLDLDGVLITGLPADPLAAGDGAILFGFPVGGFSRCEFIVTAGSAASLRASMVVRNNLGGVPSYTYNLEAR